MCELDRTGQKLGPGSLYGACRVWHLALVSAGKQHPEPGLENWVIIVACEPVPGDILILISLTSLISDLKNTNKILYKLTDSRLLSWFMK